MSVNQNLIDIHTHFLPGVDDGPKNIDECMKLASLFVEGGVTKIIATPHFIPGTAWASTAENVIELVNQMQIVLNKQKIPLKIYPGMEIAFHARLQDRLENDLLLPLACSSYYLIEPPFSEPVDPLFEFLDHNLSLEKKIILAHPERIQTIQDHSVLLGMFIGKGLQIQINSGSILGKFGHACKECGLDLIRKNYCHYLASDAHDAINRNPLSSQEWLILKNLLGKRKFLKISRDNAEKYLL